MILADPPPSQGDLHFRVAGFPVRIHPFFWLIAFLLGLQVSKGDPKLTLLAVGVVFVSILVHELGHAFFQRRYGGRPHIVLHGMGGLAICGDCDRSPSKQIIISLAGPFAGFLLAGVAWLLLGVTTGYLGFVVWLTANINLFWGVMNLLPVYPLDGGQIARELFSLARNPYQGITYSLWLSTITAGVVAAGGFRYFGLWFALMFGYLGYQSYRNLQAYTGRTPDAGWR